jgi:hypothetical protein
MAWTKKTEAQKEHVREYRRKWYAQNAESEREHVARRKLELLEWYKELKRSLKCKLCPESHPACLDFHHRDPEHKVMPVSKAVRKGWSKERLLKEISKCDCLCSNCHRKLHVIY